MASEPTPSAFAELPCACASLRRATRAVTQLYDRELRASGLRATQFTLLQVLSVRAPLRQGGLGEILALDSTTLSRSLRPLEADGLIRCAAGPDRRERLWELTGRGRSRLERARPRWERAQKRLRARLGAAGWEQLLRSMAGLAGAALRA